MKIQKGGVMKETRPEHNERVIIQAIKTTVLQTISIGKTPVGKTNDCKTDLQEQFEQ